MKLTQKLLSLAQRARGPIEIRLFSDGSGRIMLGGAEQVQFIFGAASLDEISARIVEAVRQVEERLEVQIQARAALVGEAAIARGNPFDAGARPVHDQDEEDAE